jgi:2,3-bisphosphoglycerate-dependent phosphoglycerate mutase
MTALALLRHAETAWSGEGRIQGQTDVPLSEAGCRALTGLALPAPCKGMRAVSSPLRRCRETAARLGLKEAALEPRIVEMHWGVWEGRRLAELRAELGEAMRENEARGFDFTPDGGESPRRVLERVRGWLSEIAAQGLPTVAVTHRGVIRVIMAQAYDWDMLGRPPVKLDWGAVHLFRLDRDGAPSPFRMNVPLESANPDE